MLFENSCVDSLACNSC